MTKKSAASLKVVKPEEKVDPKLNFDNYKKIELEVLKSKRILCDRIDTFTDIRQYYRDYFDVMPTYEDIQQICELLAELCDSMVKAVEGFEFDTFSNEEIDDPYSDLIMKRTDCSNNKDAFIASIRFNFVRPFAERVLRMHNLVVEDCKAAGLVTEDAEN